MKKDIDFEPVSGVDLVMARDETKTEEPWGVYIINRNLIELDQVMVTSKGYGIIGGEEKKTSTLRHVIKKIEASSYALVEPVMNDLLQLNNEYWLATTSWIRFLIKSSSSHQLPSKMVICNILRR